MRLLCAIGIHRWSEWQTSQLGREGISIGNGEKLFGQFRNCVCCNLEQGRVLKEKRV